MNFDYTLYLVTDRQLMSCDSLTEAVEQAILGGCTMIQLREKELSSLEFYNQAVAVNGGSCRLKTYSARIHRELIIKCFQPLENFCACILIPAYEIEK